MCITKQPIICQFNTLYLHTTARSVKRLLAIVILSVSLSVTSRYRSKPRCNRDSRFSPCDSIESLVFPWPNFVPLRNDIHLEWGHQREIPPLRNCYITEPINSASVRTVAGRQRLAAYHKKHCWRAFRGYQHQGPWTTLNPQNGGF